MKYLGYDVGSSSLGYYVREDESEILSGVVTFSSGMVKGKGGYSSPTRDRREARSKRTLIESRKKRKGYLLELLQTNDCVPLSKDELDKWIKYKKGQKKTYPQNKKFTKWLACDFSYQGSISYKNPYELRIELQKEKLSKHELGRALYHLVQRRGYKDIGEKDKETKKQIERRDEEGFARALNQEGTISKALQAEFLSKGRRARNQYPYRHEYENELLLILKQQGFDLLKDDKGKYIDEFVQGVWKSIIWQNPLKLQSYNIGKCVLHPKSKRCSKSHPLFEVVRTWQFINQIKYKENEEFKPLDLALKNQLFEELFLKKSTKIKFEVVKRFLCKKFNREVEFNYPKSKKSGKYETPVSVLPTCYLLIKIFGEDVRREILGIGVNSNGFDNKIIDNYSVHDLWHAVSQFDESYLRKLSVKKFKLELEERHKKGETYHISPLESIKTQLVKGHGDLSLKALKSIIPFLRQGLLYNNAVLLSNLPEVIPDWDDKKNLITDCLKSSVNEYKKHKDCVQIANALIEKHKADPYFAQRDYKYMLQEDDLEVVGTQCERYFGTNKWALITNQDIIINRVASLYQNYFHDSTRRYRQYGTTVELFVQKLSELGFDVEGSQIFHHSAHKNVFANNLHFDEDREEFELPRDGNFNRILPEARTPSIKNPMFNKAMTIIRKVTNALIQKGIVDEDTKVVVELARDLNDNNMRAAITKFQNEKEKQRNEIRRYLQEWKNEVTHSFDMEDAIQKVQLWEEQVFDKDLEKGIKIDKYTLWKEQNGQCIYTGKQISIHDLFNGAVDIEHTIPRHILPDNTLANKTIVFKEYNRHVKGKILPIALKNFNTEWNGYTAISPRLENWRKRRDDYRDKYEKNLKPKSGEDEKQKNDRIVDKHYFKMHFDYWNDKVSRFEATDVTDRWVRRQLVDTQMVGKYAKDYLKLYFKKVLVQKGSTTAEFRKIYKFQSEDMVKNRNKHTHHAIDAAVLTYIPTNSNQTRQILQTSYRHHQEYKKQYHTEPFLGFDANQIIRNIENKTLIYYYDKDTIFTQTRKKYRKNGKIQYVKNRVTGEFILDSNGNKIPKFSTGDTVRSQLFKDSFIGKIRNAILDEEGKPVRENGKIIFEKGKDEFSWVKRVPIDEALKNIDKIVDKNLAKHIEDQSENDKIFDFQQNEIRHVRVYTKDSGHIVKDRINYQSKKEYKNKYYSVSGSIPYAIVLTGNENGQLKRKIIPLSSFQVAKFFKGRNSFDTKEYVSIYYPKYSHYDSKLVKIGDHVLVLINDSEYEMIDNKSFQVKRLYRITRIYEDGFYLKYHQEATPDDNIDHQIKKQKDALLAKIEEKHNLPLVEPDESITNPKSRKDDYEKRKYSFSSYMSFRFKRLIEAIGKDEVSYIKKRLDKYKKQNSKLEKDTYTPLLKMHIDNCNFLYEGYDFDFDILGKIYHK